MDDGTYYNALGQRRPSAIGRRPGQCATYMDDASSIDRFVRENHQGLSSMAERPIQNDSVVMGETLDENQWREERQQINATVSLVGTLDLIAGLYEPILMAVSIYRCKEGHLGRQCQL